MLAAEPVKKGPPANLPSKPGPHIEKIKALGDKQWLNLGTPARHQLYTKGVYKWTNRSHAAYSWACTRTNKLLDGSRPLLKGTEWSVTIQPLRGHSSSRRRINCLCQRRLELSRKKFVRAVRGVVRR